MLEENTLFGIQDKVKIAIDRLKEFEPAEGYYLAFSGGKDSIVIKKLAEMAGVKYESVYNVTTIDPPDLIYFIRKYHPDVKFDFPEIHFLKKMTKTGFPLRQNRWCCEKYKERGGSGRSVITGIRWAESSKRRQRKMIEFCYKDKTKKYINIIIDWSDMEVWRFIKNNNMLYCKLYDEGFKRIGCLFCPMGRLKIRLIEKKKYPRYYKLFKKAFEKLYNIRKINGNKSIKKWKNGNDMFEWWFYRLDKSRINKNQLVMFE